MSVPIASDSTQYSTWINSPIAAGTLMNISDNSGTPVATFDIPKTASLVFFSSKDLIGNTTYKVSTGGSIEGEQKDGLYTSGSYKPGKTLTTFTTNTTSPGDGGGILP